MLRIDREHAAGKRGEVLRERKADAAGFFRRTDERDAAWREEEVERAAGSGEGVRQRGWGRRVHFSEGWLGRRVVMWEEGVRAVFGSSRRDANGD
ncbi:hypothetical protein LBMAG56_36500 [Verrucomicrobiota bacterium]|nr:hypothetical protein LBMAG56_36500 [Verrucomicrobiota bacterium]